MEYALYEGLRTAARPGLKGFCSHCGSPVQAKCGTKLVWHWAHLAVDSCDSWHEPETAWHREWKGLFGESCSEISLTRDGVRHIADVVNAKGIVFEFQNSAISAGEIAARERFYGTGMIWVMNGETFRDQFKRYDEEYLRSWKLSLLSEIEAATHYPSLRKGLLIEDWQVRQPAVHQLLLHLGFERLSPYGVYFRPVEGNQNRAALEGDLMDSLESLYIRHRPDGDFRKGRFAWQHPRRSWEQAERPVFIDFGSGSLYLVEEGMGKTRGKGVSLSKARFISKYVQ